MDSAEPPQGHGNKLKEAVGNDDRPRDKKTPGLWLVSEALPACGKYGKRNCRKHTSDREGPWFDGSEAESGKNHDSQEDVWYCQYV